MKKKTQLLLLYLALMILFYCENIGQNSTLMNGKEIVSQQFLKSNDIFNINMLIKPIRISANPVFQELLLLDYEGHCIYSFNYNGEYLKTIGKKGQGYGELLYPYDMDIDNKGNIYVFENGNERISIFNGSGDFISSFYAPGINTEITVEGNEILKNDPKNGYYITIYDKKGSIKNQIGEITVFQKSGRVNETFAKGKPFKDSKGNYVIFLIYFGTVKYYNSTGTLLNEIVITGIETVEKFRQKKFRQDYFIPPERMGSMAIGTTNFYHDILLYNGNYYVIEPNLDNFNMPILYILDPEYNILQHIGLPIENKTSGTMSIALLDSICILLDTRSKQITRHKIFGK